MASMVQARLVCHTTAKFIYLIQTNGSFRKLVEWSPSPVAIAIAVAIAFAIASASAIAAGSGKSQRFTLALAQHALPSYDFISLYLLSHTFSYGLNPFADFVFIWRMPMYMYGKIENKHCFQL